MTALVLVGCSVPGSGLMRTFTGVLVWPIQHNEVTPGWQKNRLLGYVPPSMLAGGAKYDREVTEGYITGLRRGRENIGLDRIPWRKWQPTLTTWMPIIFLTFVCVICMSLIVHRQWSSRERLRYPIASVATTLMEQDPASGVGKIFHSRLFWIGLTILLGINLINGLNEWFPEQIIRIPLVLDFRAVGRRYPSLQRAWLSFGVLSPMIRPMVVGFAFFVASEISLSLGLSQYIAVPMMAALTLVGVDVSEGYMTGGPIAYQRFGAYLGLALILLYTGRWYYWHVLKQAMTFQRQEGVDGYAGWACRVLILSMAALFAIFVSLGLDWPLAILVILLILLTFLVVSRLNAETGLFYIQPRWQAMGMLLALFGGAALGPKAIIILGLLSVVLALDPRSCLMPFVVTGLKICDDFRVRPGRMGWASAGACVVALAVATPVVLWVNYNYGSRRDGWVDGRVPTMTFRAANPVVTKLKLAGKLAESERMTPLQRLMNIHPRKDFLWGAGIGLALVFVFSFLRLRHSWWPLHPVMFLVWGTWAMAGICPSFLLGWAIKTAVVRLGGRKAYHRAKPLMLGIIAGDLLGGLVWMAVGAIYYAVTGLQPRQLKVSPG